MLISPRDRYLKKKGVEEGIIEGRQEGRQEGITQGKLFVAVNMLNNGFDVDVVADLTGLERETILKTNDSL